MNAKRAVALLLVALAVYFGLVGYRGVYLVTQPGLGLKTLGVAVLVLPLIGVWVVLAELRFGLATVRLARRLDDEGVPPEPELPRTPGGRIERDAADARFEQRRLELEEDPADWRRWYLLATAYDAAGDRKRARAAMRHAIARAE